ncbi:hypothetical protein [Pseudomonas sp. P129]|uniref:hypothetical protein n=1 Tax=Pseudomonas sp. P129 TaxID=2823887 RepID=UPI001CE35584|nr:hypothetical protein [Pseudomonas sp. P129]MCA5965441.1 hypothetical protein [Pseudomonas sp. P129]
MDYYELDTSFRYRKTSQSIPSILEGIRSDRIKWDPMFTYSNSWSPSSKSTFIESILVGMPTTDILCEENRYGELSILDGVQRLICLQDFFSNVFRLQGLKLLPSLEGCRYSDLKYSQSSIFHNRTELGFTVISYDTDAILKFEFFKRVHSDSYKFPVQLARNYAFREHLYFIRELQDATRNFLAPKDQYSYSFSMETTKSTHRDVSEFDELYLLLCSASLTYHGRMRPSNVRYSGKFSDLLDDTAIYLHQNSDDFRPLKDVVVETLSKARRYFGTPILFADLPRRKYPSRRNDEIILDSDSIVACFIDCLKNRNIDLDDITNRKIGYRSNRSSQLFLKELST